MMIKGLFFAAWFSLMLLAVACDGSSIDRLTGVGDGITTGSAEHYGKGNSLADEGNLEGAITEYHEAIRLDPGYAEAYGNRGGAYGMIGQYQRAIDDLDEAIRLKPHPIYHYNRGNAYNELGQAETAITDHDEAIRLNPLYANAFFGRGMANLDLGQYQKAIEDFDASLRLAPVKTDTYAHDGLTNIFRETDAYAYRALTNTYLGNDEEAQEDVDQALGLGFDPKSLEKMIEEVKSKQ